MTGSTAPRYAGATGLARRIQTPCIMTVLSMLRVALSVLWGDIRTLLLVSSGRELCECLRLHRGEE